MRPILATGPSRDFALRSCVLGMRFADVAELDHDTRRRIYHQALLRYIGCNADTHPMAAHWGDEITLRRELHHIDMGNRAEFVELMVRALKRKFAGAPPQELEEAVKRGLAEGPQVNIPILSGHCEVAKESRSASACRRTSAKVSARSTSAGTARDCRAVSPATR